VAALLAVALGACGGDDGNGAPESKAEWEARHRAAVVDVGASLDAARAALSDGEPVGIRTGCGALRDSEAEAREALPVPDAEADAALRQALDSVAKGVGDCLQAMATSDARQLERAIAGLRGARGELDKANQALAAWRGTERRTRSVPASPVAP
jgi:hypothetical protein